MNNESNGRFGLSDLLNKRRIVPNNKQASGWSRKYKKTTEIRRPLLTIEELIPEIREKDLVLPNEDDYFNYKIIDREALCVLEAPWGFMVGSDTQASLTRVASEIVHHDIELPSFDLMSPTVSQYFSPYGQQHYSTYERKSLSQLLHLDKLNEVEAVPFVATKPDFLLQIDHPSMVSVEFPEILPFMSNYCLPNYEPQPSEKNINVEESTDLTNEINLPNINVQGESKRELLPDQCTSSSVPLKSSNIILPEILPKVDAVASTTTIVSPPSHALCDIDAADTDKIDANNLVDDTEEALMRNEDFDSFVIESLLDDMVNSVEQRKEMETHHPSPIESVPTSDCAPPIDDYDDYEEDIDAATKLDQIRNHQLPVYRTWRKNKFYATSNVKIKMDSWRNKRDMYLKKFSKINFESPQPPAGEMRLGPSPLMKLRALKDFKSALKLQD